MQEKHEESVVPVASSTNNTAPIGSSFPSRFEYVENVQSTELNSGGSQVLSHVAPPKSSSFFAEQTMVFRRNQAAMSPYMLARLSTSALDTTQPLHVKAPTNKIGRAHV